MTLIVGAQFQGQLELALELADVGGSYVAQGATCSFEELWEKPVVADFHLVIKRMVEEQLSIEEQMKQLMAYNPDLILTADEIAYGFTEDAFEQKWRCEAGYACRLLAQSAECVYHMVCGIPTRIK